MLFLTKGKDWLKWPSTLVETFFISDVILRAKDKVNESLKILTTKYHWVNGSSI